MPFVRAYVDEGDGLLMLSWEHGDNIIRICSITSHNGVDVRRDVLLLKEAVDAGMHLRYLHLQSLNAPPGWLSSWTTAAYCCFPVRAPPHGEPTAAIELLRAAAFLGHTALLRLLLLLTAPTTFLDAPELLPVVFEEAYLVFGHEGSIVNPFRMGWSPLHTAAAGGSAACASILLEADHRLAAIATMGGWRPAHVAAANALLLAAVAAPAAAAPQPARSGRPATKVGLSLLGSVAFPAAEQVAYDDKAKVAYVIGGNSLAVIGLPQAVLLGGSGPAGTPLSILKTVDLGRAVNDVVFCGDWLALALNGAAKTDPGTVQLHRRYTGDARSLQLLASFPVGSLPDQIEFSKDCKTILVSNEGEPSGYGPGYVDPEGSVSIIRLKSTWSWGVGVQVTGKVTTANFRAWNGRRAELEAQGVKLNGPGASVAQDLEPEYTTFSEDERIAFVSLQENNAIATLDVASGRITAIHGLGFKDHSLAANAMDASDKDKAINIARWPVSGMFMPDELKSFKVNGQTFVVGANEGDARDWPGFEEEGEVKAANLSSSVFPNAAALEDPAALGRLTIVGGRNKLNDPNGDGKYERILSYGARSFSIWRLDKPQRKQPQALTRVYDSGSLLETISAAQLPALFNSEGTTDSKDKRSDNKGPEPEGVAIGPCGAGSRRRCLFLTTERLGAVFVFDISNPYAPAFQSLALPPQSNAADETTRFRGPEGITYASYTYKAGRKYEHVPIVLAAYEGADGQFGGLGVFRVVSTA
ncbi:alkaline phosphatase isoform A [Chlorella sorokiniana]|uniref:Alkaline phosphatase isoform A n=1 Tax=Chlorella sorokiniana TaxID=3076 RepID=A0A2P6TS31_CHLSO|nr:alkaline phosphatase isoform A [Chlorella sorokiniana]|eukprot:PRW56875.1 alkaline phosphatase isoform A [Chlorella sorokiniana]